jgi:hypothetical protein
MCGWFFFFLISAPVQESQFAISPDFDIVGQDRTDEFATNWKAWNQQTNFARLRGYHFIFVPGFMAKALESIQAWSGGNQKLGTFREQMELLESHGVEYSFVETHTEQAVDQSIPLLKAAIHKAHKPIIFLTHSRGGLDLLATLLSCTPEEIQKIAGWVAFQSPFHGTPIADLFIQYPLLTWIATESLERLGGTFDTVVAMSLTARKAYLEKFRAEISALVADIPTISVGTWKLDAPGIDMSLEISRDWMEQLGFSTDGMVPWQSAILPGTDFVVIKGVDHGEIVHSSKTLDRKHLTEVFLWMLPLQLGMSSDCFEESLSACRFRK